MSRRRETTLSYSDEYLAAQRAAEMRPGHPMQKLRTRDVEEIMRQHARIGETGVALSLGKAGNRRRRRTHRLNMHRKPKKKSRNRRRSNRRRSNRRRSNRRRSNRRRSNRRRSNRRRRQKKKKTRSN